MAEEMKCPYCGNDEFEIEDRFRNDLDIRSYDDLGQEMSFFGHNPMNGFTLVVCKKCGHASIFRNDSPFVQKKRLIDVMKLAEIPVKEAKECKEKIADIEEEMKKMDKESKKYSDYENRLKKLNNNLSNLNREIDNIIHSVYLDMTVEELLEKFS